MEVADKGKIRKVFPGGNTSKGFYSLYQHIIELDATRIFIVKGGPGVGKSTFMKAIGEELVNRGFDIEHHHCSSDPDSLDGLVIPSIRVALIDGTAPHIVDPKNPGVVDEIINLGEYWDEDKIVKHKDSVLKTNKRVGRLFGIAYSLLKESKVAYDEWQGYVAESIDKAKYNRIAKILIEIVFEGAVGNYDTAPKSRHLFASAITPKGVWNYMDTLITKGMKLYTIKGEPGTGTKEMVARTAQAAEELGLYTEQFHCPYEPDKVDMVIIPAINTVVLNTTQPYHFDVKGLEEISVIDNIDLDICIRQKVLDEYEPEIVDAKARFHSLLDKAINHLTQAKATHDDMEDFYINAMDFDKINKKRTEILNRILKYT
ncbi:MAG: PRK06851 family protein [Firmicutes bacterium]|nr:PRK06851 family protein [Bacillota bacterium]